MLGRVLIGLLGLAWCAPASAREWQTPVCPKSGEEASVFYTPRTTAALPNGEVLLVCRIDAERALICMIDKEEPAGWGFGQAALQLTQEYKLCDETPDPAGAFSLRVPFVNERSRPAPSP